MGATQNVDYDALAQQAGGVDYDSLAQQAGAVGSTVQTNNTVSAAPPSQFDRTVESLKNTVKGLFTGSTPTFSGSPLQVNPSQAVMEGSQREQQQAGEEDRARANAEVPYSIPYRIVAPLAEQMGVPVQTMEEGAREGDVNKVKGARNAGMIMAAAPAVVHAGAEGARAAMEHGGEFLRTTAARAAMPEETTNLSNKELDAGEKLIRAIAPTNTNTRFRPNVYAAIQHGDLAEIARDVEQKMTAAKGGAIQPDMRPRVTADAIREHMDQMYETERAPQIDKHAKEPLALPKESVAPGSGDGLRFMSKNAGDPAVRSIAKRALSGQTLTVADVDHLARGVNEELLNYEMATPEQQAAMRSNNPTIAGLQRLDPVLTDTLDNHLRSQGEPGIKGYERRYAALAAMRKQLVPRLQNFELQRNVLPQPLRAARSAVLGGKTGIASASQSSVADVNPGRTLQQAFDQLRDSGRKFTPATPTPGLTSPPGRMPPEPQRPLPFSGGDNGSAPASNPEHPTLPPQGRVSSRNVHPGVVNGEAPAPAGPPYEMPPSSVYENQKLLTSGERRVTPRNGHTFTEAERQRFLEEQRRVEAARHPNPHLKENPFDRHPSHSETIRAAAKQEAMDVLSGRHRRGGSSIK